MNRPAQQGKCVQGLALRRCCLHARQHQALDTDLIRRMKGMLNAMPGQGKLRPQQSAGQQ